MSSERKIETVIVKRSLKDRSGDLAYWLAQPPEARLAALEEIRQEYDRWRYGAQPRLERVYTIVKRKRS
jgi:hypothetical protein